MRKLQFVILFSFFSVALSGQTLKAFLNAGEEALAENDFYNAMYYHANALEFDTTNLDVRYKLAESARQFNAYAVAEEHYQFVLDNDSNNGYPETSLHLANVQQHLGRYQDASTNYSLFISENDGEDNKLLLKAEKEIAAIEWALEEIANPQPGVTVNRLEGSINTPYSEFGAVAKGDDFYYSSLRFEKEQKKVRVNKLFSKVLAQDSTGSGYPIEGSFNEYEQHAAHTSFNHDATRVYYTLCDYKNEVDIICDLYYRNIDSEGQYGPPVILPASINVEGSTNTQPSIGYNPITGEEVLYYASDRTDGEGEMDIWMVSVNGENFSEPENLSSINTASDDLAPFFHNSTGTLFFSSDGYRGMGGLDIFSSFRSQDSFEMPSNLRSPVNTSFNDLYYSLNEEGTKAYFSSNRIGSLYLEESYEACCYDIYESGIEEIFLDLNALTFNGESMDPLPGVTVKLLDAITGEELDLVFNPESNEHLFEIKHGREYLIVSEREGFLPDTTSLSTRNIDELDEIIRKIYLTPTIVTLEVFTFDKVTGNPLPGVTVELVEVDSTNVNLQTNSESNDFYFEVIGGRTYLIKASKPGYTPENLQFTALDITNGVITKEIYLLDLNGQLPIIVYFDNDHPDPKTRKLFSDLTYSDTYFEYVKEEAAFQRNFTVNLAQDAKTEGEAAINAFFENEVKVGYQKLQQFMGMLQQRLEDGDVLELSLKGYASPRAANKYNLALGQRRIWTIKNELRKYNDGVLEPYINNGQLVVSEVSLGEEIAPAGISDSYSDRRQSVFSVDASRERKVEIVRVRILNRR